MKNRIITISRQFGSGGRTIGKLAAEQLNIPCYDREIIEKIAEKSGFAKEYVAEHGEYSESGGWLSNAFGDSYLLGGRSNQDLIWEAQCKTINEIADKGPCVIVGRCADYVLKDRADCLRVFIYADLKKRADRVVTQYGKLADSPEKRVMEKDKRRAAYYRIYTDQKFGDVNNFDVALNSGSFGIEKCADIVAQLYRHITD